MFRVTWDDKKLLRELTNQQRQHQIAMQLALNRTQEERQRDVQEHIDTTLTIRSASARALFKRVVRFARDDRADRNANRMTATIRIIGGDTKATTDVFRRFGAMVLRQDDGGTATSSALYRTQRRTFSAEGFILPAPGLRTATRGVSRRLYPAAIGLSARSIRREDSDDPARQYKGGAKKRGRGFRKGTKYYFVKEGVGIFVREQIGKHSEYDAVWFFRRQINLPKRLNLAGVAQDGIEAQLRANYLGFYDFAMRTAR